ncbi:phosphotransferase [Rhodovarius crocodyli]|nr:phosphotransferase [Rhodovarius crocodyli]
MLRAASDSPLPDSPLPGSPLNDPLIFAPPPLVRPDALAEALLAGWGLRGSLTPLGGERDRNFRLTPDQGEALLVKVSHPDEEAAVTDFQTRLLLHLEAATDLPLPRVVRSLAGGTECRHRLDDGRDSLLRVLTFVPGGPREDRTADAFGFGMRAAKLNAALAGFAHPADGRRLLWDIREAPELRHLLDKVADPALRALAAAALDAFQDKAAPLLAALPGQVIHNDLNPHNVLADEQGRFAGIIDFGDAVRAPILQEVATACSYLVMPGPQPMKAVEEFVAGYASVHSLPAAHVALLPVMMATRMALTVLITHWRAGMQPENATYILRNMPGARAGLQTLAELG